MIGSAGGAAKVQKLIPIVALAMVIASLVIMVVAGSTSVLSGSLLCVGALLNVFNIYKFGFDKHELCTVGDGLWAV